MVRNSLAPKPRSLTRLKPNIAAGLNAHGNVEGVDTCDMADRWDDDAADAVGRLLEARGVHDVKAFALLTLHSGSDIAVRTSKNVREFTHSIAPKALRQHLRQIYEDATSESAKGRRTEHSSRISTTHFGATRRLPVRMNQIGSDQGPEDNQPTKQTPIDARQLQVSHSQAQTPVPVGGPDLSEVDHLEPPPLIHLRLGDTLNVKLQLEHRLRSLHQLPVKKIAKLWIKAICPKKQAKFPYQNKSYEDSTGLSPPVPKWWPDISVCIYTEPDHIHRDQRIPLCIHLLRLRPSPEQLKLWNKDKPDAEHHPTHVHLGWTAFLKEHALTQITDEDLRGGSPEQAARRRKLLEEIYEIAEREELAMSADPSWGLDDIMVLEDAGVKTKKKPKINRKRARASSMVPAATPLELKSSTVVQEPRQKKMRISASRRARTGFHHFADADVTHGIGGSTLSQASRRFDPIAGPLSVYDPPAIVHGLPYPTLRQDTNQLDHDSLQPQYTGLTRMGHGLPDSRPPWANTISPNSSCNSTGSSESSFGPLSSFPGQYRYEQLMNPAQLPLQVNYAAHLPQPEWDTVQNTPIGLQATLMELPQDPGSELDRLAEDGIAPMNLNTQMIQGHSDPAVLDIDDTKYEPYGQDQVQHSDRQVYPNLLAFEQSQDFLGPDGTISQATPHCLPFQYTDFHAQAEFQAPARVMRPFTGHCSGVGGGACKQA